MEIARTIFTTFFAAMLLLNVAIAFERGWRDNSHVYKAVNYFGASLLLIWAVDVVVKGYVE